MPSFDRPGDWTISIPLHELVALQELPTRISKLEEDNIKLRKELEALRRIQGEMMIRLGDAIRDRMS